MTVYTCSPDETTLVKDIWVYWRAAGAGFCRIAVDPTGATPATSFIQEDFTAQNQFRHHQLFLCLIPGDTITVNCNVTDGVAVIISGAELEGLAD